MFFKLKKYNQEAEEKRIKSLTDEPAMSRLITLGIIASFRPTCSLLNLYRTHLIDRSVHEEFTGDQIPVIYVHGFRGGSHTTKYMIEKACQAKGRHDFLQVKQDLRGNIIIEGTWTADPHPIIQLTFIDRIVGISGINFYLQKILPLLKKMFHFDQYDAVAHSLGAPCVIKTELNTIKKSQFPRLRKCAMVAGPFNGVMFFGDIPNVNILNDNGRPIFMTPHYLDILWKKKRLNPQIELLNIYGNVLDDTNTDRFISVISAKSIRYILASKAKRFHEVEVRGEMAEHSMMHDNPFVCDLVNKFLSD